MHRVSLVVDGGAGVVWVVGRAYRRTWNSGDAAAGELVRESASVARGETRGPP